MKPQLLAIAIAFTAAACGPNLPPGEDIQKALADIKSGEGKKEKHLAYLEKLAEKGRTDAALQLGYLLSEGKYFRTDPGQACVYFEQASAKEGEAMSQLGKCWEKGVTGKKDLNTAVATYEKAIAMGWEKGKCDLGALLIKGKPPEPSDPARGEKLCAEAAAAGNHAAAVKIATMYLNGDGVKKNPAKAKEIFQAAADAGDGDAALWLGSMYGNGDGVPKDKAAAVKWWSTAFEHGKPEGAKFIADELMVKALKGDQAAVAEAISWYEKALTKNPQPSARGQIEGSLIQLRKLRTS
jgi:uncharacterized protein